MKLIKPGRKQTGWSVEMACTGSGKGNGGCGAVLLVEQGDVFQTSQSSMGEVDVFATFACSECGVLTDFGPGKFPFPICTLPTKAKHDEEGGK